jgi:hypothetical protein
MNSLSPINDQQAEVINGGAVSLRTRFTSLGLFNTTNVGNTGIALIGIGSLQVRF